MQGLADAEISGLLGGCLATLGAFVSTPRLLQLLLPRALGEWDGAEAGCMQSRAEATEALAQVVRWVAGSSLTGSRLLKTCRCGRYTVRCSVTCCLL